MRLCVKAPFIGLVAVLLASSCSSGGPPGPTSTDSSDPTSEVVDSTAAPDTIAAPVDTATTGSTIALVGDGSVEAVSAPAVLAPGSSDPAVLTKDQACELIPGSLIASSYGLKTAPGDPAWSQDDTETLCEVAFVKENNDSTTPHFTWYVTKSGENEWPRTGGDAGAVMATTIGGKKAVLTAKSGEGYDNATSLYITMSSGRTARFTADGWKGATDKDRAQKMAEALVASLVAMRPVPAPAIDAKVTTFMDFSAGQLCSLVRDTGVTALLVDSLPPGTDTVLLQMEAISCSKGGAKLEVKISTQEPFVIDEKTITKVTLNGVEAFWEKPPIAEGPGLQYMQLRVKRKDLWVSVTAGSVADTPAVETILKREATYVLAQLDKRSA